MTNIIYRRLEHHITFYDPQHEPLTVKVSNLALTQTDEQVIDCHLTWQISPELYTQRVEPMGLFNLQPEVRGPMRLAVEFQTQPYLDMEARLHPELLPHVLEQAGTIDEIVSYLLELAPSFILATESWLVLSVKQAKGAVKIGYKTQWAEGLTPPINHVSFPPSASRSFSTSPLFTLLIQFFEVDNWSYVVDTDEVLFTQFYGKHGQFNCFAQAREAHEQVVFYSVCPVKVPEAKRLVVAEFLTRVNYGMIVGNFELDFDGGELRYKTSLDVERSTLTLPLIKQIVYPNVFMMDRYLPGIMKVVYSSLSPAEAIRWIESSHD